MVIMQYILIALELNIYMLNITNIYRIQVYNLIMCGYFRSGFINFMLKGKSLLDYTSLFSPREYEKNKAILKYLH